MSLFTKILYWTLGLLFSALSLSCFIYSTWLVLAGLFGHGCMDGFLVLFALYPLTGGILASYFGVGFLSALFGKGKRNLLRLSSIYAYIVAALAALIGVLFVIISGPTVFEILSQLFSGSRAQNFNLLLSDLLTNVTNIAVCCFVSYLFYQAGRFFHKKASS